jgi:type IV pilus assembly protein PilC
MPSYYYRARDMSGRAHEGIEVAASEEEVLRTLEGSQLTPIYIESRAPGGASKAAVIPLFETWRSGIRRVRYRVQPGSVALFARQLATMIGVGLPLVRSLRSIARDHHDKRLGAMLDQVADDVQKGEALSSALSRHPSAFDEVFVSLVRTGEVSGTLDTIMEQTAGYLERSDHLRMKVEAALRYPSFILIFAFAILLVMILWIVPMFTGIYSRFRVPLPWPTQVLLTTSHFVTSNWLIFAILAIVFALSVWNTLQTERGRLWLDRLKFNLPIFGPLIRMYAVTKFARTLGILTASGTQILYALRVMKPVPGNLVLERGVEQIRARVEQGSALSRAMSETGVLPEMLVQMTATGEETGQLDNMLSRTADFYEQRVSTAVDGLSSLVEPIAIVVVGVVVGLMLLALYLPIFSLGQAMRTGLIGH